MQNYEKKEKLISFLLRFFTTKGNNFFLLFSGLIADSCLLLTSPQKAFHPNPNFYKKNIYKYCIP